MAKRDFIGAAKGLVDYGVYISASVELKVEGLIDPA
jgi:hypothetical protein